MKKSILFSLALLLLISTFSFYSSPVYDKKAVYVMTDKGYELSWCPDNGNVCRYL